MGRNTMHTVSSTHVLPSQTLEASPAPFNNTWKGFVRASIMPYWQDQCCGLRKTRDCPSPTPSPTPSWGRHAPHKLLCEHAQRWCAQVIGIPFPSSLTQRDAHALVVHITQSRDNHQNHVVWKKRKAKEK